MWAVLAAVGCSSTGFVAQSSAGIQDPGPPEAYAVGDDSFYVVPDPLPRGEHGDLIRYQPIVHLNPTMSLARIMYLSETVSGDSTVVTGVVTIGNGDPPRDGWRLLLHGHGATGMADQCAPSVSLGGDGTYAAEVLLLAGIAPSRQFIVASTDYEGLGSPGLHPFLVGVSEGRSMLDAGRAARQLPGLDVGDVTAVAGYSQGGHAALWANQLAATWTPEMAITGVVAGAPGSELSALVQDDWQSGAVPSLGLLAGLATSSPEGAAAVEGVLTPAGRTAAESLTESCFSLEIDGAPPFLSVDPTSTEPLASMIAANEPGRTPTAAPVLIVHSDVDQTVPIDHSATLLERACASGQVVERRVLRDGSDHLYAAIPAYTQGLDWLVGLVDGREPLSSCPDG